MNPFWIEFFAICAATGMVAGIVEHTRKFSDSPLWAKRGRGWTFFLVGTFGLVGLPSLLIQAGSSKPINGFTLGCLFPLIAGLIYLFAAARSGSDKPYYQVVREVFNRPSHAVETAEIMKDFRGGSATTAEGPSKSTTESDRSPRDGV